MVGIDGFKKMICKVRKNPPSIWYSRERGHIMSRRGNGNAVLRGSELISQSQEIPSMPRIKPAFRAHGMSLGQKMETSDQSKEETAKSAWVARGKKPGPLSQNK